MFDHVDIRVADRAASEVFYDTVLPLLGLEKTHADDEFVEWGDFSISKDEKPVTRRAHIAFAVPSQAHVDAFHRAGVEAGYRSDGEPGLRPEYLPDYYGGFLLDPDGNSIEAVHHGDSPESGFDHLWIRVTDLAASRAFYERVAPHGGFELGHVEDSYASFRGGGRSFSLVEGEPTIGLHVAFPAATNEAVDAFHADLIAAGYSDNGPPGERPIYHPGYYGAFVLDPDGTNVELVNHNR